MSLRTHWGCSDDPAVEKSMQTSNKSMRALWGPWVIKLHLAPVIPMLIMTFTTPDPISIIGLED